MRILLTNDDGYRAPGINILFEHLIAFGHDVIMVAPELNSSGAGQSIAVYNPIQITKVNDRIYFVSSTPADSVRLGLQVVYGDPGNYPDLVIAGINMGENVGEDVLYSGTVGSAREGAIHKISSIAVSTPGPEFNNLESAAKVIVDLVKRIENHKKSFDKPFIWNINVPNLKYSDIDGYEVTSLGLRPPHKQFDRQVTPRNNVIFWQGEASNPDTAPIGTDIDVFLKQRKVSITPLLILPTDFDQMATITGITV